MKFILAAALMTTALSTAAQNSPSADPYLWLEDVQGEPALPGCHAHDLRRLSRQ